MTRFSRAKLVLKNPGEKLIEILEALRLRLENSGVERTYGLKEALGGDCSFYRKSLDLFLERDFDDIKELLEAALQEYGRQAR